jgi:uncharacterized protein YprB with RNaseH-like and TPR domain
MTIDTVMSVYPESNITLNTTTTEMLRVAKDGFYVRGIKIPQDEREAEIVYNSFHQWLTWATLNRDYK